MGALGSEGVGEDCLWSWPRTFWTWKLIWISSFRPLLSHRTQSKGIVVRPFSHWLPFGEESPAFLSLGHQF